MIGDEFLQERARLETALFSISTLARRLKSAPCVLQQINSLWLELNEPFQLSVIGGSKSGKSSLINALFGCEICRAGPQSDADKIRVFKFGAEEQDVEVTERITDCCRPHPFLRDWNIVDTPGAAGLAVEQQTIAGRLCSGTNLVLFVFSITNPWAAPPWDFLKSADRERFKNTVFVLQQCDLRDEIEVNAVTRHLEQTLRKKIVAGVPYFHGLGERSVSCENRRDSRQGRTFQAQ